MKPRSVEAENDRYTMLRLGLGCNVECPFCNVPWESYDYPMRLTLAQIKEEVDRIAAAGGRRINLSGGEPTLRPELPRIVTYARERGMEAVELQTNGILLKDAAKARALKEAGLTHAFVGLHSQIPKVHDFLVKSRGAFTDCVAGARNLIEAGVETILNPVITVVNYKTLSGFVRFVRDELPGAVSISFSVVQPHGRAGQNRALIPRYRDISPYVEQAVELAESLGLIVNNPFCGLPLCVGGWHKRLERNVEYCEAKLGRAPGDGEKIHPEPCRGCGLRPYCGGVWKEYPEIHPVVDLTPLPSEAAS